MKISKNGFKVKSNISYLDYIKLVDRIVSLAFFDNEETGEIEYVPHYLTVFLPIAILDSCIEGVELDDEENEDWTKCIESIEKQDELRERINSIITGRDYLDSDYPIYVQDAIDDAEKIINLKLQEFSPANKFLKSITSFTDTMNKQFDGVDVKEFVKTLEMIANTSETQDKVETVEEE